MKRICTLLTLTGILSSTIWLGSTGSAHAIPSCSDLNGDPCSTQGQQISCLRDSGGTGGCSCLAFPGQSLRWFCTI